MLSSGPRGLFSRKIVKFKLQSEKLDFLDRINRIDRIIYYGKAAGGSASHEALSGKIIWLKN